MKRIEGRAQRYAWGSTSDIPTLLGIPVTDEPYAEHWYGAHESAPSFVDGFPLDARLRDDPDLLGTDVASRFGGRLPYLMKLLSAAHPLSIQAHPNATEAADGFARENAAGIPLDAAHRTYRDSWAKPECVIALTEFHGLCGFRNPVVTADLFDGLGVASQLATVIGPLTQRKGAAALAEVFLDVLSLDGERLALVDVVVEAARHHVDDPGELGLFARTALELDDQHHGDRGVLAALLLNRFQLDPGEGIFLPPGNMHAYLRGFAIEVMANSDNVLRGGLTAKHIDVDALLAVVRFSAEQPEAMSADVLGDGIVHYRTHADEFTVWRVETSLKPVLLPGSAARIVLATSGEIALTTLRTAESVTLRQGEAAFVPASETPMISGAGTAFVAAPGI